jgi:asparagine synthase (glutamine-hydrolysing)
MVTALRHRGPDGQRVHLDAPVGLGHARLSIIDIACGTQPIHNEDRSVCVVFNGEIFNYVELRQTLVAQGHRFSTESDTEVIVHLYEQHGDDFVQHLNGQFAIALWDRRRRRLVLARDRVGIRPLFYTWTRGRLAFASEMKALFTLPDVKRALDPDALASTFSYWSVLPPRSVFEGVSVLPPGSMMIVDDQRVEETRYWDWSFDSPLTVSRGSELRYAEELRELLIDAVRLQLRADVPVGAYLSGGLDSSIITAIIAKHTNTPLRSFSITFDGREFDESEYQRALVDHLRTDHSSIRATSAGIGAAFPRMIWHAEAPVVRTAPTPIMLLADSVREAGYKVVLTGEGADEAFGGYDIFKEAKVRRHLARRGGDARRSARLLGRLYPYLAHSPAAANALTQSFLGGDLDQVDKPWGAHMSRLAVTRRTLDFFRDDWRERLKAWDPHQALVERLPAEFERWQPLERDQYVEAHTLMSGYLLSSQGDRMAMAASIEARFPFLDHRVIEFAGRLPPGFKLCGLNEKAILKRALASELPPAITRRSKQPYRAPDSASFFENGQPLPYVAELLSASSIDAVGMFDPVAVGKLMEKCRAGRAIGFGDNIAFVGILSTMLLHQQYLSPGASPPSS